MSDAVVRELAPQGVMRAGINMSNMLLVTGRTPDGGPDGVSPDMARAIAARLGVEARMVPFAKPSQVADAVDADAWDICLIGDEPARAAKIAFTPAYVEIEANYLVPAGSPVMSPDDVDRPGTRIAVMKGSAYGLWLERNIRQATLLQAESHDAALKMFTGQGLEVLAGLRTRLVQEVTQIPGARLVGERFTSVQQAIGTQRRNTAAAAFLRDFVREAIASGLVQRLIDKHGAHDLSVARL